MGDEAGMMSHEKADLTAVTLNRLLELASMRIHRAILSLCFAVFLVSSHAQDPAWLTSEPGFHALAITSNAGAFWICGPNESVASSPDGKTWTMHHRASGAGAMLFGIDFFSPKFGYAYGTGGTVVFTSDGGETWETHHFGSDTILLASFADPTHGLLRTAPSLFYLDGSDSPHQLVEPADTLQRFAFTPFLAVLSPEKMAAVLTEGPYAEGGFLATVDGGKTWSFYDPPSTGIKDLLRVDGKYWSTGHEVVGKDKPGGGYGVPMATYSDDGTHWTHTSNDIHPCHWESCVLCNNQGCLASGTLLVDFFHASTTYAAIPKGALTAKWAVVGQNICTMKRLPMSHCLAGRRCRAWERNLGAEHYDACHVLWSLSSSTIRFRAGSAFTSRSRSGRTERSRWQRSRNARARPSCRRFMIR